MTEFFIFFSFCLSTSPFFFWYCFSQDDSGRGGLLIDPSLTNIILTLLHLGPLFLCWFLGVVPFKVWLISRWEENKCCYRLSKCTKWHLFHSKWMKLSFWVKIVVIFSVAQHETTVISFSAWDMSRVKWDNSWNSTQKMRTSVSIGNEM